MKRGGAQAAHSILLCAFDLNGLSRPTDCQNIFTHIFIMRSV